MKRIISIFLASVMIISAVLCVDLSALATDVEVSNRAEWLSKLTQVYDMTVEEDNYPDNYFSDLSSDSPYYRDIMVAAEFGLIDIEAGEAVNPEGDITREFAAQTLNFCAGWELEKGEDFTYSFADYESCAYPDDDQIAVDHKWIALDGDNNFNPDQKVTAAEIETMLADAQETLKGDEVDENYESTFEYGDGVVEVPADTAVDFNDNEVVIHSTKYDIKENGTFVVYSNGIPVVYTAVKVTNNGDSLTVKTSEDVDGEAVEDIDMQETVDFNASDFVPAEGFEVVGSSSSYSKPGAKKANPSITLSFKKEISDDKTFSFNVKLSDIKLSAKICTKDKSATVKATYKIDYDFEGKLEAFNINDYLPDSFGSVPFAGIGFVEFKPDISVSGKIKLGETFFAESGITVDGGGIHSISSFKKQRFSISLEVKLTIGVKVEIGVKILILKAGVYAKVGVTAKVTSTANVDTSGNYLHCLTLSAYLHFTLGAEVELDFIAWKFNSKIEWKIFKESNSPIRLYFHFENGTQVTECTVGNSKYVTPSGTNYGSVSDTNAYTGSNAELNYSISGGEVTITGYKGSPSKIVIPSKINGYPVTSIGKSAFWDCRSLTSITIPNSVTSIGDYAFWGCTGLTSITIPNSVTSIGKSAFESCDSLTSITIPNSVTYIPAYAFRYCYRLTSITIPDSVTSIGEWAFISCKSLTSITIPDSVTSIGNYAFSYCTSLTSIVVDSNNKYYDSRNNCNAIIETSTNKLITGCENTVIPNSVTSIDNGAFEWCISLTRITIPNSVTSIGNYAFCKCSQLTGVTLPSSVTSIGEYAFASCTSLTSITIPNSVKSIGGDAFKGCTSLTSITIPNSVTSIGAYAFDGCTRLTSITIPNSITRIGNYAFWDCRSLTSITIPNSVTSIGKSAFESCDSLTSITIPNSVTSIGEWAFNSCTSLTDVYYTGTKEQWNAISIGSYNSDLKNATIHYPPHEHSYNSIVTPPTCTAKGYTTHTCECGDSYVDTYVDALGHTEVTDAAIAATCTTDGKTEGSHCSVCGEIIVAQQTVNALGHKSDKGTVTKKATYTATGVKTYKCTVCGKVLKTETIAKLPKKANTLIAKGKTATVKFANLKKKNQTVTQKNAFTITKAQGKVTYKKASGNGKITVNSAGKFTVKKGLKKGTYKIKVKVTAAGNTTYKAVTKTVTVTIKVK